MWLLLQAKGGTLLTAKDVTDTVIEYANEYSDFILLPSSFSNSGLDPTSTVRIDYTCLCDIGNYPVVNSTTGLCDACPSG